MKTGTSIYPFWLWLVIWYECWYGKTNCPCFEEHVIITMRFWTLCFSGGEVFRFWGRRDFCRQGRIDQGSWF